MPISSMTGFGRGEAALDGREAIVEIKSVNHRFLDVSVKTHKSLAFVEDALRLLVQDAFSRGHFDVTVNYNNTRSDASEVVVDDAMLDKYLAAFASISKKHRLKNDIKTSDILRLGDVFSVTKAQDDREAVSRLVAEAARSAAEQIALMRKKEGEKLRDDLLGKLSELEKKLEKVKERAPKVVEEYRNKLSERIAELCAPGAAADPQRLAQEVAIFADKAAIDEEIVRLSAHIGHMRDTFELDEPVGRKLDFLTQEMNREVNTIGSKANDLELVNLVVSMKNDLEKIREQVQNIE
ncbi:MAG: YicC family protein [Eubacteriales bacterium]|nr:YicC family protein [Eubacteriales bacterium]